MLKPDDTVILDNLQSHKVIGVREAIEAAGARLLYPPAYSPDFNPVEQAFSNLKALLRTAVPEPSQTFGRPLRGPSQPSHQPNAVTTSPPPDTTLMTLPKRRQL